MKRVIAIISGLALFLSLCSCGQATEGRDTDGQDDKETTWQEQYDLGLRHLEDGDYEEAIAAFTEAIDIDSRQASAYVSCGDAYAGYAQTLAKGGAMDDDTLEAYENAIKEYRSAIRRDKTKASVYQKAAEIYILLDDTDAAVELLQKGLRATEDQSLQDFLNELTDSATVKELTEGSPEWQALEEFLSYFGWYGDYDCETAAVRDAVYEGAQPRNALEKLVTVASCYCYDDSLYPGEALLIDWEHADPLNKWDFMGSYGRASEDKMDWLLENIFNCSPEDISAMKQPIMAGENEEIYYLDGSYYFFVGGIGGGFDAEITHVEPMEDRYYIEYDLYDAYSEEPEKYCASMSLKSVDGKEYWTLYYNRLLNGAGYAGSF